MRKKNKCFILLFAVGLLVLFMTGCGKKQNQDFFDTVESQIHTEIESSAAEKESAAAQPVVEEQKVSFSVTNLPEHWYNFGIYAKRWAAVIIVASIVLGGVIFDIFKKNREVQKWAFDLMVIRIPAFTFIIVYLYAFLYRMLNL